MPVKSTRKPEAKKAPVAKKAAPAPKVVEKPKPVALKAPAAKPLVVKSAAKPAAKVEAPKAKAPKAETKKTISREEFHKLAVDLSFSIWEQRRDNNIPGDQDSDWNQAVEQLQKKFNVK